MLINIIPAKPAGEPIPATGRHAELLLEIMQKAHALIGYARAEQAGTFDGQGRFWLISDPILSTAKRVGGRTRARRQPPMARRGPPADARARKQRRADGMRRLRARRRNNIEQYLIEISAREKALATKFAGLQEGATDKAEIAIRDFRKYKQSDEAHDRELAVREEIESEISRLADKSDELEKLAGVHEEAESARELRSSERRVRD